jgi:hypothetical protein
MNALARVFGAAVLVAVVAGAPARAQELLRPGHLGFDPPQACLNQRERRGLIESGAVLHLAVAIYALRNKVPGSLVRARLCRRADGFVYVLTVLAHDGKVTRLIVDAAKGTLLGDR